MLRLKQCRLLADRQRALSELGKLGDAAAPFVHEVAQVLEGDLQAQVRVAAAQVLEGLPAECVRPHATALTGALRDPAPEVRRQAVAALGGLGIVSVDQVEGIKGALRDEARVVRSEARKTLIRFGIMPDQMTAVPDCSVGSASDAASVAEGPQHTEVPVEVEGPEEEEEAEAPRLGCLKQSRLLLRRRERLEAIRARQRRKRNLIKSRLAIACRDPCLEWDESVRGVAPHRWGTRMLDMIEFHNEIVDERNPRNLQDYCKQHHGFFGNGSFTHVCVNPCCPYGDHAGVPFLQWHDAPPDVELTQLSPNMHLVVSREIKPRTEPYGCSYALMRNPDGLAIDVFVTHSWNEIFSDFVGTLRMAIEPEKVVWVCSFALNQNACISSMLDSDDLLQSPFALALRQAPRLVVVLDPELGVPLRAWCAFEIGKAAEWGTPTFLWPSRLSDVQRMEEQLSGFDVRNARASVQADEDRIHQEISQGLGYRKMNDRLKTFVGDRLRFYRAAVVPYMEELSEISSELESARQAHDVERAIFLEAQQFAQLRLLQAEAEQRAASQRDSRLQRELNAIRTAATEREEVQEEEEPERDWEAEKLEWLQELSATKAELEVERAQRRLLEEQLEKAVGRAQFKGAVEPRRRVVALPARRILRTRTYVWTERSLSPQVRRGCPVVRAHAGVSNAPARASLPLPVTETARIAGRTAAMATPRLAP